MLAFLRRRVPIVAPPRMLPLVCATLRVRALHPLPLHPPSPHSYPTYHRLHVTMPVPCNLQSVATVTSLAFLRHLVHVDALLRTLLGVCVMIRVRATRLHLKPCVENYTLPPPLSHRVDRSLSRSPPPLLPPLVLLGVV